MIRELTPEDLPAVVTLEAELFGIDGWSRAAVADLLEGPGRRGWVATAGDTVRGYALTGLVGDFAELLRIGVQPSAQRSGLARRLLDTVVAAAAGDGADRLLLEVSERNGPALALYAGHGFVPIDQRRGYYRDGSAAVVLMLPLAADDTASGRMAP